jgi:hypothetical protein
LSAILLSALLLRGVKADGEILLDVAAAPQHMAQPAGGQQQMMNMLAGVQDQVAEFMRESQMAFEALQQGQQQLDNRIQNMEVALQQHIARSTPPTLAEIMQSPSEAIANSIRQTAQSAFVDGVGQLLFLGVNSFMKNRR